MPRRHFVKSLQCLGDTLLREENKNYGVIFSPILSLMLQMSDQPVLMDTFKRVYLERRKTLKRGEKKDTKFMRSFIENILKDVIWPVRMLLCTLYHITFGCTTLLYHNTFDCTTLYHIAFCCTRLYSIAFGCTTLCQITIGCTTLCTLLLAVPHYTTFNCNFPYLT